LLLLVGLAPFYFFCVSFKTSFVLLLLFSFQCLSLFLKLLPGTFYVASCLSVVFFFLFKKDSEKKGAGPLLFSAFAIPASKSLLCLGARRVCSLSSLLAKSQYLSHPTDDDDDDHNK